MFIPPRPPSFPHLLPDAACGSHPKPGRAGRAPLFSPLLHEKLGFRHGRPRLGRRGRPQRQRVAECPCSADPHTHARPRQWRGEVMLDSCTANGPYTDPSIRFLTRIRHGRFRDDLARVLRRQRRGNAMLNLSTQNTDQGIRFLTRIRHCPHRDARFFDARLSDYMPVPRLGYF